MAASQKIITDFTEGPLFWKLLRFAVPFMLSNAMQVAYSVVDMMVVGRYVGRDGLAAVALASRLFVLMTMLCNGFVSGGQVVVSQLIGSGERHRLNNTIGTLFTLTMGVALTVSVAGIVFCDPILHLMNAPAESFSRTRDYLLVCSAGLLFVYGYNMVSAVLRGMGDSRHPFEFIVIASVINIVLDVVFVAWFGWDVFGAALATILGQAFAFLYSLTFLYRNRVAFCFDFQFRSLRPEWRIQKSLFKLGVPFAARMAAVNISMMYVYALVGKAGPDALATFGTGITLDDTANKVCQGVMQALAAVVGQNYGARKFARVRQSVYYTWAISVGFYIVFGCAILFFTEPMFGLFTK
ncbi:MAG: MATE family efflux transporter, partial [Victivallales bacterium]|nr:MATE family efflux transporter [Victivallales bacterium]